MNLKIANRISGLILIAAAVAACSSPTAQDVVPRSERPPSAPSRTLVIATRTEPDSVATRRLGQAGSIFAGSKDVFNAVVSYIDEAGNARPNLVESLPTLNSEGWQVFPDGRMETRHRLKTGLRWHDGTPVSAEDVRLSWQVYAKPEYGLSRAAPFSAIDEVVAADERTFVIRWKQPYAGAGTLSANHDELPILPGHILRGPFEQLDADGFVNLPFWNREYVGLGPYRLDRWEAGSFLEGAAFDAFSLGAPKIQRVRIVFIADNNTTLANLMAGQVDLASDNSIALAQLDVIKREASDRLALIPDPSGAWRSTVIQQRPEFVGTRALLDNRVREALARSFDKDALNESVYFGLYLPSDFMVPPNSQFGPAAGRGAVKYGFDPRRSEQLMNAAGFFRGSDGFYASDADGRMNIDFRSSSSGADATALAAMASGWRQLGFNVQESLVPVAEADNAQLGNTFPGLSARTSTSSLAALDAFTTPRVPRPETRWIGSNRGGWSNPEYDRWSTAFLTTLDDSARAEQVTQMARIFTEEIPVISQFFLNRPVPYPVGLSGPKSSLSVETTWSFNIHEWEFR